MSRDQHLPHCAGLCSHKLIDNALHNCNNFPFILIVLGDFHYDNALIASLSAICCTGYQQSALLGRLRPLDKPACPMVNQAGTAHALGSVNSRISIQTTSMKRTSAHSRTPSAQTSSHSTTIPHSLPPGASPISAVDPATRPRAYAKYPRCPTLRPLT
ncbi:hypothetical protein PLICRDRAFT_205186 [Plicaturopsis crispa FD-325 SS-3]|nr:hypothetical protein PLICRDRAFT_205186 [Plicaturopsis crispa FD-325 SS-3]